MSSQIHVFNSFDQLWKVSNVVLKCKASDMLFINSQCRVHTYPHYHDHNHSVGECYSGAQSDDCVMSVYKITENMFQITLLHFIAFSLSTGTYTLRDCLNK